MHSWTCPACRRQRASNARCLACRDVAMSELARKAAAVEPRHLKALVGRAERFLERRTWWVRSAPADLMTRLRLLWLLLRDVVQGRHWLPWDRLAVLAGATAYVLSPADFIPDFLGPLGFADDGTVVAVTWKLMKAELADYCAARGLAPGHFGIEPPVR